MLAAGQLTPSLCRGLPKVAGVPTAAQLCPITLLFTDYKLLTKMSFAHPSLCPSIHAIMLSERPQYCIYDGGLAILSAVLYLQQRQVPGFFCQFKPFSCL
jgi:hypothetical protein